MVRRERELSRRPEESLNGENGSAETKKDSNSTPRMIPPSKSLPLSESSVLPSLPPSLLPSLTPSPSHSPSCPSFPPSLPPSIPPHHCRMLPLLVPSTPPGPVEPALPPSSSQPTELRLSGTEWTRVAAAGGGGGGEGQQIRHSQPSDHYLASEVNMLLLRSKLGHYEVIGRKWLSA